MTHRPDGTVLDRRRSALRAFGAGVAALVLLTLVMLPFRDRLDKAHVALVLLLVTLGGSAAGGRTVGLGLSAATFVVFNWFFLPPYHTLHIENPLDWLVLMAFLVTSTVAAQLLYSSQEEARIARERTAEVDRLRVVGSEALNAGRAEHALATVASVIRDASSAERCDILTLNAERGLTTAGSSAGSSAEARGDVPSHDAELARWVAGNNKSALQRTHGAEQLQTPRPDRSDLPALATGDVRALLLPLSVRDRVVGILRIASASGLHLDGERWRFVDALSYYAALGVERVRLVAAEEHAEALRETDRLKDALLASVSHDLRTPLTTIKARAHELRIHGDERAEVIEQEADRLNRMVADLLDLSRLNAGVLPVTLEMNAVDELIELVVQRVEGALAGRPLKVRLSPDGTLLFGRFDLAHSVRILVNLVDNAHKYSPSEMAIEIVARRDAGEVVVDVVDHGPGLGAEEMHRAFEPFYRAHGAAPDVGGTGLGLSIARRLAEVQGATLRYSSSPRGGSVFSLAFPAVEETDRITAL